MNTFKEAYEQVLRNEAKTIDESQPGLMYEAQIKTPFEADEMKSAGGDKAAKKMGIKVKVQKGKGDGMMGSDLGTFTGDEEALVKYFQDYMGAMAKNFKELQKEF